MGANRLLVWSGTPPSRYSGSSGALTHNFKMNFWVHLYGVPSSLDCILKVLTYLDYKIWTFVEFFVGSCYRKKKLIPTFVPLGKDNFSQRLERGDMLLLYINLMY